MLHYPSDAVIHEILMLRVTRDGWGQEECENLLAHFHISGLNGSEVSATWKDWFAIRNT
ncbi:protein of unknown function (plasmid) [Azospirillum baldaniorum]|uniref:Uncharacterized protein n=1 Tax=Azospirillum baldaniorum TaxID=1064539 RepID=A0A9P1K1J1_9PROT|nr:protein of unknown function [Azospirillum baldaniorum]